VRNFGRCQFSIHGIFHSRRSKDVAEKGLQLAEHKATIDDDFWTSLRRGVGRGSHVHPLCIGFSRWADEQVRYQHAAVASFMPRK